MSILYAKSSFYNAADCFMSIFDLETFKDEFAEKEALVIGLGKFGGGVGAVKFLSTICRNVLVCEQKASEEFKNIMDEFSTLTNVRFKFGQHQKQDFDNKDIVILNPSVMINSDVYRWAKNSGAMVFTEISLFCSLCSGKIIGITGTLGKSTLASSIYTVLKYAGMQCWLGGNIGGSLLPYLDKITATDIVLLELSSFQLQYFQEYRLHPYIGIILNLYPDHLDKHSTFDEYKNVKINLIRYQSPNDCAILNFDAPEVKNFKADTQAYVYYFSVKTPVSNGTFIIGSDIYFSLDGKAYKIFDVQFVKNKYLHLNTILALVCCAKILNVNNDDILNGINTFKNLEHRMEFVGEYKGRKFINDSNATTPQASIFGLDLITDNKIVITGGKNKNINYEVICKKLANEAKAIFLIGETTPLFRRLIKQFNNSAAIFESSNLQQAVISAYKISSEGDCIILSPSTSSFDQFSNFVERGNQFKKIVKEIMDGKL